MSREAKAIAAQIARVSFQADVELAAVDGHHVAGTAYHWRHDWHPLDVRTATLNRKKKAARALHAAGAPHFIPEPDGTKFHQGVKPLPGGLHAAPKGRDTIETPVGTVRVGKGVEYARPDGTRVSGDVQKINPDNSLNVKHHGTGQVDVVPLHRVSNVEGGNKGPEPKPEPPKPPTPTPEPPKPAPAPKPEPEPVKPPAPAPPVSIAPSATQMETPIGTVHIGDDIGYKLLNGTPATGTVTAVHAGSTGQSVAVTATGPFAGTTHYVSLREITKLPEPTKPVTPKVDVTAAYREKVLKAKLKSHGGVSNLHNVEASHLENLQLMAQMTETPVGKELDKRIQLHLGRRQQIETQYGSFSEQSKHDLEKRYVNHDMKKLAAKQVEEDNKKRIENADHGSINKIRDQFTEQFGSVYLRNWSGKAGGINAIETLAKMGDPEAISVLPYAKKREAKVQAALKKHADSQRRLNSKTGKGAPVSAAIENTITNAATKAGVEHGIAMIDKVHSDGELVPLPVKLSAASARYGQYVPGQNINISKGGDHHALTFTHEVGHWLDNKALADPPGGGGSMAYQSTRAAVGRGSTPEWDAWWTAVKNTEAVKGLNAQKGSSYQRYTMQPLEIWARSYAQYVAVRSGSPDMQKQAADIVALRQTSAAVGGYTQWEPADFAPVAAAIDGILKAKGWK